MIAQHKQCMNNGALACKSTGSGGGGFSLILLDPAQTEEQQKRLSKIFGSKNVHFFLPLTRYTTKQVCSWVRRT